MSGTAGLLRPLLALLVLVAPFVAGALPSGEAPQDEKARPGYTDTPLIPGQTWRVHDSARPYPVKVTPGRDGGAPSDAIVLFDGKDLSAWRGGSGPATWKVADGAMEVTRGAGDIRTRREFGSCQLHLEWASPAPPKGEGQGRGNSGLFLMERYEIQILDSFASATYADGQAAAFYGQFPPLVNACRDSGEWQTYDVVFEAPRFDGETLVSPARATVFHNGVLVHHAREFLGGTAHRTAPSYRAHPARGPIKLQDHDDPVRFRNVWVREL
ncbi:MAG: DUF1080 domain-containing protein [Planctomycetota bacterium]